MFAPVIGFGRYHPANPAARVRNIPAVSRNQVNVRMVNRLPGRPPVVDSDVERFSSLFLEKELPGQRDHLPDFGHFFGRQFENAGDMSTGNDERVSLGDRITVVKSQAVLVLKKDSVGRRGTERTGGHAAYITPPAVETQ